MIFNQDILNFEDNYFFVCNNRLTSLLESGELNVMENMFPILELCINVIVLVILTLNPKLTSDSITYVLLPFMTKPLGHAM
jgi:hypothetical protein